MRAWDPLSIFKHLSGFFIMHFIMSANIIYRLLAKPSEDGLSKEEEELNMEKDEYLKSMAGQHLSIGILQAFIFYYYMMRGNYQRKKWDTVVYNIIILVNVVLYQGLIIQVLQFFIYELKPGKGLDNSAQNFFENMDSRDMLMWIDIVLFASLMLTLMLFLIGALYTQEKGVLYEIFTEFEPNQYKKKDFLDSALLVKLMFVYFIMMTCFEIIALVAINLDKN